MTTSENTYFILVAPGRLEQVSVPLPPPPTSWVRVRFVYCGLCGSDVTKYAGGRAAPYPVSMGHEWVAVVEEVAPNVGLFARGDVVTSDLNFRCGRCRQCVAGRTHLCERGQVGYFTNRGFGLRANIHASYLHRFAGRPAPHLALAEPLACVTHAYNWANVGPDDHVLIIGAGGMGVCMSFQMAHVSPSRGFDVYDVNSTRLASIGAVVRPVGRTVACPDDDYDVVFDVSGSESGLRQACESVSPGGRICTMSHLPTDTRADFLVEALLHKDVTLTVSYLDGNDGNFAAAMDLLESRWDARWDSLVDVQPLASLALLLEGRGTSRANKTIVDIRGLHEDES